MDFGRKSIEACWILDTLGEGWFVYPFVRMRVWAWESQSRGLG